LEVKRLLTAASTDYGLALTLYSGEKGCHICQVAISLAVWLKSLVSLLIQRETTARALSVPKPLVRWIYGCTTLSPLL
jgi:hypothetical protein